MDQTKKLTPISNHKLDGSDKKTNTNIHQKWKYLAM